MINCINNVKSSRINRKGNHKSTPLYFGSLYKKDKFMADKNELEFIDKVSEYFSRYSFEKIGNDLLKKASWNNGMDVISAAYDKDWKICDMQIMLFNPQTGDYTTKSLARKEFIDFLNNVCKKYIAKNPDEKDNCIKLFEKLTDGYNKLKNYN